MNIDKRIEFLELFKYHEKNENDDVAEKRMDFMLQLLAQNNFSLDKTLTDIDSQLFKDVAAINLEIILDSAQKSAKIYFSVSKKALVLLKDFNKKNDDSKSYLIGYSDLLQNSFMKAGDLVEITYLELISFLNDNLNAVLQAEADSLRTSFEKYVVSLINYNYLLGDKVSAKKNKSRI